MSYDIATDRIVVFGGWNGQTNGYLNDTWEFDGSNWQQIATTVQPSPRTGPSMTYDAARSRSVLYGGWLTSGPNDETWEYAGGTWTLIPTATSPPAGQSAAMVFNTSNSRVLMAGGRQQPEPSDMDTWEFDGADWTQILTPTTPAHRCCHDAVYDSQAGCLVMLGGFLSPNQSHNETWRFAFGQPAQASSFGAGCGTYPMSLEVDDYFKPVIGELVRAVVRDQTSPFVGITVGLDNQTTGGQPLPIDLAGIGMPGCRLYHSAESVGLTTIYNGTTRRFVGLVPLLPSLIGSSLFVQAYAYAPNANPLQVVTSNALEWVLGDV